MLIKFLFIGVMVITLPCFSAESWFHFKGDANPYDSYSLLKHSGVLPKKQEDRPLRYSTGSLYPEIQSESLIEINKSKKPLVASKYYSPWGLTIEERNRYTAYFAAAAFATLGLYGVWSWEWGSADDFKIGNEGWFEEDTYAGGADKIGHMFSLYYQKRAINWFLINMGWSFDDANLYSALIAESLGIALEVGDGFSHFLFSWEDLLFDTIGVLMAYCVDKYPWLDELVGLRLMWFMSDRYRSSDNPDREDLSDDYDGMTFLLTFRASGVARLKDIPLVKYLTLDLGYYTRGYRPHLESDPPGGLVKSRNYMIGIGVNLSELVFQNTKPSSLTTSSARLLKYWTPPKTVLPVYRNEL